MAVDVLIVGGGLSGLIAAQTLQAQNLSVMVLDKGRSTGGRLATRRIGNGLADHGAQFFTARTDTFQKQIDEWLAKGLVRVWGHGWSDGSLKRTKGDGHPRYVTNGGMNALAKDLTEGLHDVRVNVRVDSVEYAGDTWTLRDAQDNIYTSRALLMTPPAPQTRALLNAVPLSDSDREALERIQFGPCLCGLFVIEGDIDLPEPGAIQNFEAPVYWIADNTAKGISPDEHIITLHAEARFSREHYDDPDEHTLAYFREALQPYLAEGTTIQEAQLKKWRYSVPQVTHPRDTLVASGLPLVFAGDAFGGRGRMEGAYMSGLAAATALIQLLA